MDYQLKNRLTARAGRWVGLGLALVALAGSLAAPAAAQAGPDAGPIVLRGAEASEPVTPYVFKGDIRDLPRAAEWRPGDPIKEIPRRYTGKPSELPPEAMEFLNKPHEDPLVALQAEVGAPDFAPAFSSPFVDIAGQGYTGVNPPDTVGDVGPDYYIQVINGSSGARFTIYDKTTGNSVAGPTQMDSLGSGNCASGLGDGIVLYDDLAGRWMLTEFSNSGSRLCVYISQTGNPVSGGWYAYAFQATNFPDYPKYGVWSDAYYVATNENSPAAYALDRSKMLLGQAATFQRFTAPRLSGFGFQALTPTDADGPTPPPAGAPGIFIRHRDGEVHGNPDPTKDTLEYFEFKVNFANPNLSTFTGPLSVNIAEIDSNLCGLSSFSCFPQPGTNTKLDPLREVVMFRSQYRNFGGHESLVGNLVTDVAVDRGGVRWYELRKNGPSWTLFQEGTYSIDNDSRWMGSAAMDADGNLAVGYNVTSTSTYPSLRYVGRKDGDPLNVMTTGEAVLLNGTASNGSNRYGDYSGLNVDSVDGCTFWFTGEYNLGNTWSTRIGAFRFDTCVPVDPTFVITSIVGNAGASTSWNVSGASPGSTVTVTCNPLGAGSLTVGSAVANGSGDAVISRTVPPLASGRTIECSASAAGQTTPKTARYFN